MYDSASCRGTAFHAKRAYNNLGRIGWGHRLEAHPSRAARQTGLSSDSAADPASGRQLPNSPARVDAPS